MPSDIRCSGRRSLEKPSREWKAIGRMANGRKANGRKANGRKANETAAIAKTAFGKRVFGKRRRLSGKGGGKSAREI